MRRRPGARGPIARFGVVRVVAGSWLVLVVVLAVVGPWLIPDGWLRQDLLMRNHDPGWGDGLRWLMGGDPLGRSLLGRIVTGSRSSLVIGFAALVLAVGAGTVVGLVSGGASRWVDDVIMRLVDVASSFPALLLAVLFLYLFGTSRLGIIIVLAATRWPVFARVVRAEVLRLREHEFIAAYRVLSYSRARMAWEGYIPNFLPPVLTLAMVNLGQLILAESALSFLGLGVQPPDVSWGLVVSEGRAYTESAWWIVLFPGLAILFTALASSYLADTSSRRSGIDPLRETSLA